MGYLIVYEAFWFQINQHHGMNKFRLLASEPKDKTVFRIEGYDELTDILEILQKRICDTEGEPFFFSKKISVYIIVTFFVSLTFAAISKWMPFYLDSNMGSEMSQSKFSAVFYEVSQNWKNIINIMSMLRIFYQYLHLLSRLIPIYEKVTAYIWQEQFERTPPPNFF